MTAKITENSQLRDRIYVFKDRFDAGKLLANNLKDYRGKQNVLVLALPAGGVPVGYILAKELAVPFDIAVVRKIQIPWATEAGFGAITWDGQIILNQALIDQLNLTQEEINTSIEKTKNNIQNRLLKFRGNTPLPNLAAKIILLVDDGLASGFTMLAAVKSVKAAKPQKIVVAVPTASQGAIELLASEVDEIVCPNIRSASSFAVAEAYENWYDLTDEEVMRIIEN